MKQRTKQLAVCGAQAGSGTISEVQCGQRWAFFETIMWHIGHSRVAGGGGGGEKRLTCLIDQEHTEGHDQKRDHVVDEPAVVDRGDAQFLGLGGGLGLFELLLRRRRSAAGPDPESRPLAG